MISLDGFSLTIEQLLRVADEAETVALAPDARERIRASRAVVERRAQSDEPAYGINTGFGSFADVKIPPDALEMLQLNLLRSHAAGLGDPFLAQRTRGERSHERERQGGGQQQLFHDVHVSPAKPKAAQDFG